MLRSNILINQRTDRQGCPRHTYGKKEIKGEKKKKAVFPPPPKKKIKKKGNTDCPNTKQANK